MVDTYREEYNKWLNDSYFDDETKKELLEIKDDEKEIEDRFYTDLKFGTGGLRGIIGAGTNRMNKYIVRKATQGLANYIAKHGEKAKEQGVVIAYDSRKYSDIFAEETALVLNASGIKTYVFDSLRPTPELSFAIRELGAKAGVVITASHNPAEYNGYKVYWEDGGQIVPKIAEEITAEIENVTDITEIYPAKKEEMANKGLYNIIGKEVDERYINKVISLSLNPKVIEQCSENFKIVYTPLHGTGNIPVREALKKAGFNNVFVVEEQEKPDPEFSTVRVPNPEERDALNLAIKVAEKNDADIVLGTDPDCDRVGVAVKHNGEYVLLTGNQIGALLVDYICSSHKEQGKLPDNGTVVKTIVTSELGQKIAQDYGIETVNTLTGFKFIGEKIKEFEEAGNKKFIFGWEESYGYLAGTFVRDKDAVIATLLICEMAAFVTESGKTLYDRLNELYEKYGFFKEELKSIKLTGVEGVQRIERVVESFRNNPPKELSGLSVVRLEDYKNSKAYNLMDKTEDKLTLPKSNVLHFRLEDDSWFCIRPSGTEPKLKIYFSVVDETGEKAEEKISCLTKTILNQINNAIE